MAKNNLTELHRGIIYCYTNNINKKRYIGQTTNEYSRRYSFLNREEYCTSHKKGGRLSHFDLARKKYGVENFTYEILETVEDYDIVNLQNKLDELEKYYISKYDTFNFGYNSTSGGNSGKVMSNETRELMSKIKKELFLDKENHPMYNKHHSEESKHKMSESMKGKLCGKDNPMCKGTVLLYDLENNLINRYDSAIDAAKVFNKKNASMITRCCKGTIKTAYGFVWKYEKES